VVEATPAARVAFVVVGDCLRPLWPGIGEGAQLAFFLELSEFLSPLLGKIGQLGFRDRRFGQRVARDGDRRVQVQLPEKKRVRLVLVGVDLRPDAFACDERPRRRRAASRRTRERKCRGEKLVASASSSPCIAILPRPQLDNAGVVGRRWPAEAER